MGFWPFQKKIEDNVIRCVQHYYQLGAGACTICGSALCQGCIGNNAVPVCRYCADHPLTDEERALAEESGKPARKPRKARKSTGKGKARATHAPKPGKAHRYKPRLAFDQKQVIMNWAAVISLSLLAILLILTLLGKNPFGVAKPKLAPEAVEREIKEFAFMAVDRIEMYQAKNGKLPASLADVGITDTQNWAYEVMGGGQYLLTVTMDGRSFSFNSNQDPSKVFPGMVSVRKAQGR